NVRLGVRAHIIVGRRLRWDETRFLGADETGNDVVDNPPNDLLNESAPAESGIQRDDGVVLPPEETHAVQVAQVHQLCADSVVYIVIVVSDLVRKISDLRLEPRLPPLNESLPELAKLAGVAQRAMLQDAFPAFEREIESAKLRVALLQLVHNPQRLQVVLEAAVRAHALIERVLA